MYSFRSGSGIVFFRIPTERRKYQSEISKSIAVDTMPKISGVCEAVFATSDALSATVDAASAKFPVAVGGAVIVTIANSISLVEVRSESLEC